MTSFSHDMMTRGRGGVWIPPKSDDVIYEQPLKTNPKISSGRFWRTCSRTSSRRPPASSTCARSTSPTTAPPGRTGRNQFCYKKLTNVSCVLMSVQQGDSSLSMLAWQAILWERRKAAQLELQLWYRALRAGLHIDVNEQPYSITLVNSGS